MTIVLGAVTVALGLVFAGLIRVPGLSATARLDLRPSAGLVGWPSCDATSVLVMRIGGVLLIAIGLLQISGVWGGWLNELRAWIGAFGTIL